MAESTPDEVTELTALHPRQSRVIECRFFGWLTAEETVEVLQISPETIARDWRMAKAWLRRALSRKSTDDA